MPGKNALAAVAVIADFIVLEDFKVNLCNNACS